MLSSKSKTKPKAANPTSKPTHQWTFVAIGTNWWIGIYQPLDAAALAAAKQAIAERIELFDRAYSRFRADSLVSRIARCAGEYPLPADAQPLLDMYRRLYKATDGLVTPLIGQVLSDAGYDAAYSLRPKTLRKPPAWEEALDISANTLVVKQPVLLDFGAAGKGYLVDLLSDLLKQHGFEHFCIDGSGDMYVHGLPQPLRIGLEHPDDPTQAIGVATLEQGALCGSAGNRRAWGAYHHIMNPQSLQPVRSVKAVWVYADGALEADGLATALFFVKPQELHKHFRFAHCIVDADNTVQYSAEFPAELFKD